MHHLMNWCNRMETNNPRPFRGPTAPAASIETSADAQWWLLGLRVVEGMTCHPNLTCNHMAKQTSLAEPGSYPCHSINNSGF